MKGIFEMMCPAALNLSSSFVGSLGKCDWETGESLVLRTMTFDYASVKIIQQKRNCDDRGREGVGLPESKSSLKIINVSGHYNSDVILLTDEKQTLNKGPCVSIMAKMLLP